MTARAGQIAEEVFLPAAMTVDRADRVPPGHLDLLAEEGFYGIAAPPAAGGLGRDGMRAAGHLVEALASGSLATTFVWLQHHGPVIAASVSQRPGVAERWVGPLARGERRGGIALTGLRSGALRVRAVDGGFVLDGEASWVTGWDMIDTVQVAARDAGDVIHYLLVDAAPAPTLTARLLELVAVQASRTVNLTFAGHFVPADRLTGTQPFEDWARSDASGSALNGFLALGLVRRCCRLLEPGPLAAGLDAELAACRQALLTADATTTPAARAAASQLALRATAAVAVHTGSRAVLRDNHAQRLVREAAFLLVFGSRPAIRDCLLHRLGE
jgi:alkylation response protein AidB-like acyl-CoA dehydrogenase